jgi:hypothetical protein
MMRNDKPAISGKAMFHDTKLTRKNFDIDIAEPFPVFEIGDILDRSDYRQLLAEFPAKSLFPRAYVDKGNKSFLDNRRPEFFEFLKTSPIWAAFYRRFFDPEVTRKLYEIVAPMPSERPPHQNLPWKVTLSPNRRRSRMGQPIQRVLGRIMGYTPATVGFEFSYLEAGCFIPPHTDNAKKLISLMMYFPDEGIDYGNSAGTDFYRGKDGKQPWSAWRVGMLPEKESKDFYAEHETFHSSLFEGNKLVGFLKSSISWHGLKSLQIPPGATRRSVNINYYAM